MVKELYYHGEHQARGRVLVADSDVEALIKTGLYSREEYGELLEEEKEFIKKSLDARKNKKVTV